jgi:hypothetical protein
METVTPLSAYMRTVPAPVRRIGGAEIANGTAAIIAVVIVAIIGVILYLARRHHAPVPAPVTVVAPPPVQAPTIIYARDNPFGRWGSRRWGGRRHRH